MAVKQRLDDHRDREFQYEKKSDHNERPEPAGKDAPGERARYEQADPHSGVGDEAQQSGEQSPQQRIRQSDEIEADADRKAVRAVDDELHQQVTADADRKSQ